MDHFGFLSFFPFLQFLLSLSRSLWMHNKHFYIKRQAGREHIQHCEIQPKLGSLKTPHNSTITVKLYTIRSLWGSTEGSSAAKVILGFSKWDWHRNIFQEQHLIHICWAFKPHYCRPCGAVWKGTGWTKCVFYIMLRSEWLCCYTLSTFVCVFISEHVKQCVTWDFNV